MTRAETRTAAAGWAVASETFEDPVALRVQPESDVAGPWNERYDIRVDGATSRVVRRRGQPAVGTVVLIHSIAMNHRMWEPLVSILPDELDVIAYDVRAHGASTTVASFSMQLCAEDLRFILDELNLDRVHVAGISMGGGIAQEFAIQHPERTAALTLMATSAKGNERQRERAEAGEREGLDAQVDETLQRWLSPTFIARNGPWVRYVRGRIVGWSTTAWGAAFRGLADRDTRDRLAAVAAPTLCLAGEEDASTPLSAMKALSETIMDAQLDVVPGPHLFALEQPSAVAPLLWEHHKART